MGLRLHRSCAVLRLCAVAAPAVLLSFMSPAPMVHAQSPAPPLTPWRGLMDHVSVGIYGWPTSGWVRTYWRAISADGRFVVMDSQSSELVPGDTNFSNDVFLRDRMTGTTSRVSVGDGGTESDGWSELASISANGRHVVFSSNATNLVPGMTDWHYQVYVRDLDRGRTVHVSVSPAGVAADADSGFSVLSSDGRFVAFLSAASTLVPGVAPFGPFQAYVHDRDADEDGDFDEPGATALTLVSRGPSGDPVSAPIDQVRISGDGRSVLMLTAAALDPTAAVSGDVLHAYLHDRSTGATTLVDRSVTGGASAWGVESRAADLSDDGRYVTYPSISHDIVWLDMNWTAQVFRYDRLTGDTVIVSRAPGGALGNGHSYNTSVSSDGRYVAFATAATNLTTPAPVAGADALIVRDMTTGTSTRIDVTREGQGFDQMSKGTAISGDGSAVVLTTSATNTGIPVYPSYLTNVFVATAFSAAPLSATYEMAGGAGSIDVNTTPVTGWKAESLDPSWITIMEGETLAAGPRTVTYHVAPGSSRVGTIRVGQQLISIRQVGDDTPPIVEPVITGTLGLNGWYVSNVHVSWTVSDPDSPVTAMVGCVITGFAADTGGTNVICQATSGGGTTSRSVTIRRDATAPNITLSSPQPTLYDTGTAVNAGYVCSDGLSGLAACAGPSATATPVDTLTPGYHTFTVTGTDRAGNTSTRSVEYAIGANACTLPPADLGGWWRMEGDTLNAVSYSTTPATRVGLPSDVYTDAVVGRGYNFQVNGYLRLNYGGSISNDRKFAIAAWINPTSSTQGAIVSHKEQYRLARLSDGNIAWALRRSNGTFNYISTGARAPLNVWSHVVVALDVDRVRTYVNGRLVHTYVNPGTIDLFTYWPMTTAMVTVGATEDRGEFFNGGIDEVQLYLHGLDHSQVEPMYLAGGAGLCVPKKTTFDVAQPIVANYGAATYPVIATLRDSDGQPVAGRSVYMESIAGAPPYSTSSVMRITDAAGTVRWDAPLKNAPLGLQSEAVFLDFAGDPHYVRFATKRDVLVEVGTPVITWPSPQSVVYGAALSPAELNATANVAGTFTYTPAAGTVLDAGTHTLSVQFEPTDMTRYTSASSTVQLEVRRRAPAVEVIAGTFTYDGQPHPASATVSGLGGVTLEPVEITYDGLPSAPVNAGTYAVVASYTGSTNYEPATASATLTIARAAATVTWQAPADVVYGTPLGATQLNAAADVPGTFSYSPAAGTILEAGTHPLSVTFTPDDGSNHLGAAASVMITVSKATPAIAWPAPDGIVYGTALEAAHLNATAGVPGAFSYSPATGTVLGAGTHTLTVTFTPEDAMNYAVANASVAILVAKAAPVVAWTAPAGITYGTALGGSQLNATADVPGAFEYSPAAGTLLTAGAHALSVTFTPADTANYTPASAGVTIEVARAVPALSWSAPASVQYGTALNVAQLNATADVPGTFGYSPAAGTVLPAGTHTLAVTFTPDDAGNYIGAGGSVTLVVRPAPLTIRPNESVKVFGAPLPPFSVSTSDFVNGETLASLIGTLSFSTTATAASAPGTYPLVAAGLSSPNYSITYVPGVLTVVKAGTGTTVAPSTNPSGLNQAVSFTATVGVLAPGTGDPTGSVQFFDAGTLLGTAALVSGQATLATNGFAPGSHAITAVYSGDANFAGSNGGLSQTVNSADTSATIALSSSRHPSEVSQTVTFTATVSSPSGNVTGLVEFYDGTTLIGANGVSDGVARLITSSLAPGGHAITARYAGNGTLPPSVSMPIAQHVEPDGTRTRNSSTAVLATPSPSPLGGIVTLRAVVSLKGNTTPGGRVLFVVNGAVFGDPAGVALTAIDSTTSEATLSTSALARGTHAISAVYLGDGTCRASVDTIAVTVN